MKTIANLIFSSVLGAVLFSCTSTPSIQITNPSDFDRLAEPVVMTRAEVMAKVGDLNGKFPIVKDQQNKEIPSQLDDIDLDGKWDELAFEVNLKANSATLYRITLVNVAPEYEKTTQFYMAKSETKNNDFKKITSEIRPADHIDPCYPMLYQYEGFGWENNKVAFRSYFDSRNGKDIFGKKTEELVLQNTGQGGKNYHKMDDWGMDLIKVGSSLGSGAIGIEKEGQLYRLGLTASAKFETITEGPVRAIGRATYIGWTVDGDTYDVVETISIWKDKYNYTSEIALSGNSKPVTLITGIVNYKSNSQVKYPTLNTEVACVETFAPQTENKADRSQLLGMAIVVEKNNFVGFEDAPNTSYESALKNKHQKHGVKKDEPITDTYLVKMNLAPNKTVKFNYFSGWELTNSDFKTEQGFLDVLALEADKLAEPITTL
ncbi:DUF4861 domain-containing protein [Flammeovirga kamogawensis]|uniref:DUF4861 domain-containing protein n=1 Tax=Flammeovirga kamogawensis TaxID=373891 RepID=A0ABX8H4H1_9BACT|nr:DUF4861 domain-containing protein [Flammeovirga kamogawensis]MBB6461889.1 hypothetical protein [Flammeovirga kamogawensis]QWG10499.1 DUF4861 domain-containing protein [Flammeovirga kamogawensis]TRX63609.1 DUF4861 domain-containing protein [Flammeovirga kamogawensis]